MPARAPRELAGGADARRREGVRLSRTALITGASGGIGYELALLCAQDGFDCVLVARSHDKIAELAARLESEFRVKTLVIPRDLSKPNAVDEIYEEVSAASMAVDMLVNNAGFPVFGLFTQTQLEPELEMLNVNVIALTALTKLFHRGMMSGKTIVIPGFSNKLIPWVVRVSPRGVVTRVVRRMQERVTT